MKEIEIYKTEHAMLRMCINSFIFDLGDKDDKRNAEQIQAEFMGAVEGIYNTAASLLNKFERKENEHEKS